jgi:hypothetical protein
MQGCAGSVYYIDRGNLCGNGHVCSAAEWLSNYGGVAPKHHFWVNDDLLYSIGTGYQSGHCFATNSTTGSSACGTVASPSGTSDKPMRVCDDCGSSAGSCTDPEGNTCTWVDCGLNTTTNQYFGGCTANNTAGTLCCP